MLATNGQAQMIQVDTTPAHATNRFVPNQTLGAGIDRIPVAAIDKDLMPDSLNQVFKAGWQPVTYRQNTELAVEAWHWNPKGTWSDPSGKGYFTGSATPAEAIRYSYGYSLPRRGFTRNDGTDTVGFSRLTDGNPATFWKSNPYLTQHFTGESDSLHPQWIVIDLAQLQDVDSIRIAWTAPYATHYLVQRWTGDDPIRVPTRGIWQTFANGTVTNGKGGSETIRLSPDAVAVRFLRILMTRIFQYVRFALVVEFRVGIVGPQKLRRIRDQRNLRWNHHGGRKIPRHRAPHTRSGTDNHLLFFC